MRDALRRAGSEGRAAATTFLRKPAAVFFTFVFPLILVGIVGVVVSAGSTGLFGRSQAYYVPGYLALVVLLTPFSRTSTSVARHRTHRRFEKLATTPLRRLEWFLARALVNAVLVGLAGGAILAAVVLVGGASVTPSPLLPLFVLVGAVAFTAIGALLGRISDSEDGAIAASNGVGFPILFLADTFLPPEVLPEAVRPIVPLLPLTPFARGVRAAVGAAPGSGADELVVLVGFTVVVVAVAVVALPWTE